jgi:cytochrome P450
MQNYALVRTTLDLPDELLKRAKIEAVERGVPLGELIGTALTKELGSGAPQHRHARRLTFPIFTSRAPGSLELTSDDLTRAEWEENLRRHSLFR